MNAIEVLTDSYGRIREAVHEVLDGIDESLLTARVDPGANTIAWLVWHLTRVQDDHVAEVAGAEQRWLADGWVQRFGLPLDPAATGYGATAEDVATVRGSRELLAGYYDAVHQASLDFLAGLTEPDLDRIVDTRWDPPVTLGVRLVSVLQDDLMHAGQAAYARGVLERR